MQYKDSTTYFKTTELSDFVNAFNKGAYIRQVWERTYPANKELVNQIFQNLGSLKPTDQREFLKKLNSNSSEVFWTSVAELYFANFLHKKKYSVELHPNIKGRTTHPEMKAISKDKSTNFYLEVKTFFEEDTDRITWRVLNNIVESAKRKVDNSLPYHISIYAKDKPPANIKYSSVVKRIQKLVSDYKANNKNGPERTLEIVIDNTRFTVWITNIKSSTLSFGVGNGGSVNTVNQIRRAIKNKSQKYGKLKKPFVLVLDSKDATKFGTHQIENALFGLQIITWKINPLDGSPTQNEPSVASRDNSGILKPKKFTRLSAVIYHDLRLFDTGNIHTLKVYHNPFAELPLEKEVFKGYPQYIAIETSPGKGYMKWIDETTSN